MPNSAKITVVNQRAAFKEGAEWEAEREKWISVTDMMPEDTPENYKKHFMVFVDKCKSSAIAYY